MRVSVSLPVCVFFLMEQYTYVCTFFCYSLLMPDDNSLVTTRNAFRLRGELRYQALRATQRNF